MFLNLKSRGKFVARKKWGLVMRKLGWPIRIFVAAVILHGLPGIDQVVAHGDPLPTFDLHCPMLSLPPALGTTLATIPGDVPYLRADPIQVEAWRTRFAALGEQGPRIGLVWNGNPRVALLSAAGAASGSR